MEENRDLQPTMNKEDVEKLMNFVKENTPKEDVSQDTVETGENRLVSVAIDPNTGKTILNNTEEVKSNNKSFEELIDQELDMEKINRPITLDEIKEFVKDTKDDPMIQGQHNQDDLSVYDLDVLLDLVTKYQNKEEISSLYKKLPDSCKKIINKSLNIGDTGIYNNQINALRNTMSEMFLDQFVSSITMNRANDSINSGIEKIFEKASSEIGDTIVGYTEERNQKYRDYVEQSIQDPDKKADALKIIDSIDHSYELTEFKEYCKTCKIRKIDVEKPTKNNKLMDLIMDKYKDDLNLNIYNIYNVQTVLTRNINEDLADCEQYTDTQIRAFFIAFSMYCKNFSPKNVQEHIFMFYTLYNILLMDVNKGEKAEVSKQYLANIKDCIESLIKRNQFLN